MKKDTKEAEKLTELLAQAEGHPMMKAILAEKAAETLAKRQEAAGKIEVLKKERDEVIPKLQADLKTKEIKYLKAKTALDTANDELQTVKAALSSENHNFDTAIRNHEAVLIESADPRIDEGIEFFRAKLDYLRSPGRISRTGGKVEKNLFTWTKVVSEETNIVAVRSALAYCQNGIRELEKMKLSPELDTERIEALKSGIPKIDEYQEVTGTKPMEKQAPTFIPPSDYEIERLLKKKV
jgi:Skp family chaperone for outer membrane proteins